MKNDTVKKLKSMRLPAFAEAYEKQIDQEDEYSSMSFHERLMLLVDAEYDSRHNNNIKRLIKNARLSDSSAFLGNIDYLPDRHLNRDLLESLADNDYIRQGLNVILIVYPSAGTVQRTGSSEDTGKISSSDEAVSKASTCDS